MILCIRYFFEKTNMDYVDYNTLWNENDNRMIYLETEWSKVKQMSKLIQDIQNNHTKDILSIRFPNKTMNYKNDILKQLQNGDGIIYNSGIWYPSEIWIYK